MRIILCRLVQSSIYGGTDMMKCVNGEMFEMTEDEAEQLREIMFMQDEKNEMEKLDELAGAFDVLVGGE